MLNLFIYFRLDLRKSGPGKPTRLKMNNEKLNTVKNEIKNTMAVMKKNINKVIDRGDKLDDLEAKSGIFSV